MKKKPWNKIIRILFFLLLIALLFLLLHTIRNVILVTNLQKAVSTYTNRTNYHVHSVNSDASGITLSMDYYKKDTKQVLFMERTINGSITKMSVYSTDDTNRMFIETASSKIAKLDENVFIGMGIVNYFYTENVFQTIFSCMLSNIKPVTIDGNDCYLVTNFASSEFVASGAENNAIYIEKDTGLVVRYDFDGAITRKEYTFDQVSDTIFEEPDIREYTIAE